MPPQIVDVVMPVYNSCTWTKQAIESIFLNVKTPSRILVINNASVDETTKILEDLKAKSPNHIELIHVQNSQNLGWIGAINKGFEMAAAPYVVMANNDIFIYKNTIEEMIAIFEANPQIGLVNPDSNEFESELVKAHRPFTEEEVLEIYETNKGKWTERCSAIGFFAMVRRDVLKSVGGLGIEYGLGYAEDIDFSEKVLKAGFLIVRARGAYAHHFGSKTFKKESESIRKLKEENRKLLRAKWGEKRREAILLKNKICEDNGRLKVVLDLLAEKLREKTGFIYVFVPKKYEQEVKSRHDHFRVKPYRFWGGAYLFFYKLFQKKKRRFKTISDTVGLEENKNA